MAKCIICGTAFGIEYQRTMTVIDQRESVREGESVRQGESVKEGESVRERDGQRNNVTNREILQLRL